MGDSVQVSPPVVQGRAPLFAGVPWWHGAVLLLLIALLYWTILAALFGQWRHDPNFQHGVFVPAFALFVLWQTRHKLKRVRPAPSWAGVPIIAFALMVLVLGVLGAELFLSRVSLLLLLAGLIVLFLGWDFFRAVLFPWAVLFLMIPIPQIVLQNVTFPLQILASKLATGLLREIHVPVLREGNVITIAAMKLEVVAACSGIRSLLSLVTLAVIYGYLMEQRPWVRAVLACSAVPIAVLANGFRIFGTGLMGQYWGPEKAEGFFHSFSGWLIFVVSLIMLFALHGLITRIWKVEGSKGQPASSGTPAPVEPRPKQNSALARLGVAAALMLATTIALHARSQTELVPDRTPLSALPRSFNGWVGQDYHLDEETLDILGPGEFLARTYDAPENAQPPADLFIAYYPSQRATETPHSPDHCLPGAGWTPTLRQVVQLPGPDGPIPANRYVVSKAGDRQLVLYWFQAHGRAVSSGYWSKYYLALDSIRLNRSDGALVRLMTPMYAKESPEAAQARLWSFGSQVVPLLDQYIPR